MSHRTIIAIEKSGTQYPCLLPLKEWVWADCGIFQGEGWEPVIARVYLSETQLDDLRTAKPTVIDGTAPCAIRIEAATNFDELNPDPGYIKDVTAEIFYLAKITTVIKARLESVYCLEFATEQQWWDGYSIEETFNDVGVAGLSAVGDPLETYTEVIEGLGDLLGITAARRDIQMPAGLTYIPLTVACGGANGSLVFQRILSPVCLTMFEDIYDAANGGKFYVAQVEDVINADVADFDELSLNGDHIPGDIFFNANPIPDTVRVYFGDVNQGAGASRFEYRDYAVPGGAIGTTDTVAIHCMERPIDEVGTSYANTLQTIADELGAAYIANAEVIERKYQVAGHIGIPTTAGYQRMRSCVRRRDVSVNWEGVYTTLLFGSAEYYSAHKSGEIASPEDLTVRFRSDGAVDFKAGNEYYLAEVTSYVLISANYYRYSGEPHSVAINPASTNSANVTLLYTEDVIGASDSVVLFNTIEANNTGAGLEGNSMDENWLFDFFADSGYYIEGTDGFSIDQPINLTIQDGLVPIRGVPIVQYIPIGTIARSGGGADAIVGITSYENHAQMSASTEVVGS